MRLVECCPSWHDGELRVDPQPVMDALGVAVGAGPCLRCPLREQDTPQT